jgi:hypothetical protein
VTKGNELPIIGGSKVTMVVKPTPPPKKDFSMELLQATKNKKAEALKKIEDAKKE